MQLNFLFFLNSILFGAGLAMDAFSVSMANGLHEPEMKRSRMCLIAGTFGVFQTLKYIPWIALILLLYIGGKMLLEGIRNKEEDDEIVKGLGFGALMVQGIATSIDALSVGFTIADYDVKAAVIEAVIIGVVTFFICIGGLVIGKKVGTRLQNKASILGGVILIAIGIEIFITGII